MFISFSFASSCCKSVLHFLSFLFFLYFFNHIFLLVIILFLQKLLGELLRMLLLPFSNACGHSNQLAKQVTQTNCWMMHDAHFYKIYIYFFGCLQIAMLQLIGFNFVFPFCLQQFRAVLWWNLRVGTLLRPCLMETSTELNPTL